MNGPRVTYSQIITDGDMSGAITSSTILSESLDKLNVFIRWSGVSGTGSSITIEGTLDDTTWVDVGVTEPTISGASGSGFIIVPAAACCWKKMRVSYAEGSVTAGSLQCYILGQSK